MENQEKTKELKEAVRNLVAIAEKLVIIDAEVKIANFLFQEFIDECDKNILRKKQAVRTLKNIRYLKNQKKITYIQKKANELNQYKCFIDQSEVKTARQDLINMRWSSDNLKTI
jgi:hypothetical protein